MYSSQILYKRDLRKQNDHYEQQSLSLFIYISCFAVIYYGQLRKIELINFYLWSITIVLIFYYILNKVIKLKLLNIY